MKGLEDHLIKSPLSIKAKLLQLFPFFLFYFLLCWFVSGNIFFWDTVQLGSKHASYFYEHNFSSLLLPDEFDSGHIPTFGFYLALCWKLFGKSLMVSHFAMLPFLLGIVWQAYNLLSKLLPQKYILFALSLFLLDPGLLGQSTIMSPDVPLVFFFLTGLNALLTNNRRLLFLAITGLFLTSMRGMMVSAALLSIDLLLNVNYKERRLVFSQLVRNSIAYIPALIIFLAFNIYHFKMKGWISYHEDSPWANCFLPVDLKGFIYNIGLLIWRLIDFGRVFLWIAGLLILGFCFKRIRQDSILKLLIYIFLAVLIALSISFLSYKNLNAHRYILPVSLSFSLVVIYLVFVKLPTEKLKYLSFSLLSIGLITGNLWVYPEKIAMGWDSTLAHLPYYNLRKKMMNYIEKQGIQIENIGSAYPNLAELRYLELNDSHRHHTEKNLDTDQYILYSNIYNDFTDQEIDRLKTEFKLLKEFKKMGVYVRLYQKITRENN